MIGGEPIDKENSQNTRKEKTSLRDCARVQFVERRHG